MRGGSSASGCGLPSSSDGSTSKHFGGGSSRLDHLFLKIAFGYPEPGGSVLTNHRISEAQTKHQGVTKQLPRARKRAGSPW